MPMSPAARKRLLGTIASDRAPWEKEVWDKEMDPFAGCPAHLRDQVSDYALRRHVKTSNQNLEELCRQKEKSNQMVKEFKFENQADIVGEGPDRIGQVMHCLDFLEKLNTIIPAYLSSNIYKGTVGLAVKKPGFDKENPRLIVDWQYVCSVQIGYNHEYSTIYVDAHNLPLNHKWIGWRGTVLLRLITGGFITEDDAHRVFGEPRGSASRSYREQLFNFRNRGKE
jgi:hypothetical protein